MTSSRLAVLAALAVVVPASVRADAGELRKRTWRAAATTTAALLADGVVASVKTHQCRICVADATDLDAREDLRWGDDARYARTASDLLANGAIPLLAAADAVRSTRGYGSSGRDLLVVAEAASLTTLATSIAKDAFARRRPGLAAVGAASSAGDHSFWSGHTAFAFSVAVAEAMQDTMRGDRRAPWVWAVGLSLAGAVGYLRVAGDAHWLTDVVAGAAVGGAIGAGVPLLEARLVRGVTLAPAPGGIAIRW